VRASGRCPARAGLALTGLLLTVAGCGHVLPLGLSAIPVPSRLASAIVLQPALVAPSSQFLPVQGPPSPVMCPAGYATFPAGDQPPGSAGCYRKLGTPTTFTTAAATVFHQPAGPHGQPARYALSITLPPAEAAALTAITTNVAGTQEQLAIIIAGQAWGAFVTPKPLTNGEFEIPVQSLNQALQLQRIMQPHSPDLSTATSGNSSGEP
jgi:hypothetical protein